MKAKKRDVLPMSGFEDPQVLAGEYALVIVAIVGNHFYSRKKHQNLLEQQNFSFQIITKIDKSYRNNQTNNFIDVGNSIIVDFPKNIKIS